MAKFLSWATDVLDAVDQSAASISQKDARRRRSQNETTASDSFLSEGEHSASGYESESRRSVGGSVAFSPIPSSFGNAGVPSAEAAEPGGAMGELARSAYELSPALRPTPISSLGSGRRDGPMEKRHVEGGASPAVSPFSTPTGKLPGSGTSGIDPLSALFAAKAPSPALAKLRAIRRALEGRVWADASVKAQFEEEARRMSESEAKVSVMIVEVEKLRLAAARAASAHAHEKENLSQEQRTAKAALGKESSAFAAAKVEWEARSKDLKEEAATYARALESLERQTGEKAEVVSRLLEKAEKLEAELDALQQQQQKEKPEEQGAGPARGEQAPAAAPGALSLDRGQPAGRGPHDSRGDEGEADSLNEVQRSCTSSGLLDEESLEHWMEKLKALEEEMQARVQAAAKAPTPAQRESYLERQLRSLGEQLVVKQAQAEELTSEVQAQRAQLARILQQRAQLRSADSILPGDIPGAGRASSRSGRRRFQDHLSAGQNDVDSPGRSKRRLMKSAVFQRLLGQTQGAFESVSQAAGAVLSRSSSARLLLVAYIFSLHFVVMIILSFAASQRKAKESPHFS